MQTNATYVQPTLSAQHPAVRHRTNPRKFIAGYLTAAILLLTALMPLQGAAQSLTDDLSLSFGVAAGTAPQFTLGTEEGSGGALLLFGDLQYRQIIGQVSFTSITGETIGPGIRLDNAWALHGALGYSIPIIDRVEIPILATVGGMSIDYSEFEFSTTDANVQVGVTVAPRYALTAWFSLVGTVRYMQGIVTADASQQIDLVMATLGVRFRVL